jgi:hypothetical protein
MKEPTGFTFVLSDYTNSQDIPLCPSLKEFLEDLQVLIVISSSASANLRCNSSFVIFRLQNPAYGQTPRVPASQLVQTCRFVSIFPLESVVGLGLQVQGAPLGESDARLQIVRLFQYG